MRSQLAVDLSVNRPMPSSMTCRSVTGVRQARFPDLWLCMHSSHLQPGRGAIDGQHTGLQKPGQCRNTF